MASTRRSEPEGDGHVDHSPHYTQPRWLEGKATTADLAARTAQMWLTNPVNKMQLPEVMMFADKCASCCRESGRDKHPCFYPGLVLRTCVATFALKPIFLLIFN